MGRLSSTKWTTMARPGLRTCVPSGDTPSSTSHASPSASARGAGGETMIAAGPCGSGVFVAGSPMVTETDAGWSQASSSRATPKAVASLTIVVGVAQA